MEKIIMSIMMLTLTSCTENSRARNFGGTVTIHVAKGYKCTMATWKNTNLFYFIEPMDSGYIPKTKWLIEDAQFGILNGKIQFIESK